MRLFDARHDVYQPAVFEPLQGGFVVFAAGAFLQVGIDELFVFFGKLLGDGMP